jgi:hypothetical protein
MSTQPNPYQPPQSQLWPARQLNNLGLMFGDEPIATFQYLLDDDWFGTLNTRRQRAAMPVNAPRTQGRAVLSVIVVSVVTLVLWLTGWNVFDPFFMATVLFVLALFALHRWFALHARHLLRQSKSYNTLATSIIFREGIVSQERVSCSAATWEAFSLAARFPDGFLLNTTAASYWFPMTGLTAGRIEDIAAVLQASIPDYKEIQN